MTGGRRDLDHIASEYDSMTDFDRWCIEHEAKRFVEDYDGGAVLELGCAGGGMTRPIAEVAERLVVVDGSEVYLAPLREELAGRAQLVHARFEEFDTRERFRHIVAARILEHLDDPVPFLRRLRGWLEPEGRIHVIVPNARSFHRLLGFEMGLIGDIHELGERDHRVGHVRVYDADLLEEHLVAGGLRVTHRETIMVKVLSNAQMESWPPDVVRALFRMTKYFPDNGNELYFKCTHG